MLAKKLVIATRYCWLYCCYEDKNLTRRLCLGAVISEHLNITSLLQVHHFMIASCAPFYECTSLPTLFSHPFSLPQATLRRSGNCDRPVPLTNKIWGHSRFQYYSISKINTQIQTQPIGNDSSRKKSILSPFLEGITRGGQQNAGRVQILEGRRFEEKGWKTEGERR